MDNENLLNELADRFCAAPLPESVCSDKCASMQGYPHRSGTNLLSVIEAREVLAHVLQPLFDSLSEAVRERDEWEARHKEQRTEIAHLRALEAICENRSDVVDGDEGRQLPNEAMSILMEWRSPV